MNVEEYMKLHGLTDADLDRIAEPYEKGTFELEPGEVHIGSHMDAVGKRRITVVYDAQDTQRVAALARSRGIKPSDVYRAALEQYLQTV